MGVPSQSTSGGERMEGFLYLLRHNRFGQHSLRKRYFIIKDNVLRSFKTKPVSQMEKGLPDGFAPTVAQQVVSEPMVDRSGFKGVFMRSIESPLDKVVRAASPAVLCGGVMDLYVSKDLGHFLSTYKKLLQFQNACYK
ncbi:hypothetical protein PIB30_060690 [Stylosanthes scabra]|uniref:Uncharacterized protein n=1 Tax=Stylosanthes scabra TaxID=79078 RepID=A0ABU6SKM1_9FABA|nr:hypothetical protein [Stylosanthes scabra]